jgi:hypothetical protein
VLFSNLLIERTIASGIPLLGFQIKRSSNSHLSGLCVVYHSYLILRIPLCSRDNWASCRLSALEGGTSSLSKHVSAKR